MGPVLLLVSRMDVEGGADGIRSLGLSGLGRGRGSRSRDLTRANSLVAEPVASPFNTVNLPQPPATSSSLPLPVP